MTSLRRYISLCFSLAHITLWAADNDTVPSSPYELKEVVVTTDTYINKDGYEVLFLSNKNRNYGTNALDAVSSLSRFITSINENKLLSWDRSEVFILINGIPSTATDLRSFKGKDIKNVEYYQVAPPQYMGLTNGPLINVVLKKRHDRLYSGYFNTSNALTTGFGTNQIDLSYTDSLNQFKVGYFVDYRSISDISSYSTYDYGLNGATSYNDAQKNYSQYHSLLGSYQYFRTNQLFSAKLTLTYQPSDETSSGDINTISIDEQQIFHNNYFLKTNYKAAALDLYYNYFFKNNSLFAINIVNTLGRSDSESAINSPVLGSVKSLTNNRSYSFVTNAFYASRALGGNYTIGSRYEYKQLIQDFSNTHIMPASHNEFLNAGISWSKNGMSLVPAVGLNLLSQSNGYTSRFWALPYFRVYADWWGSGFFKGVSVQMTLLSRSQAPTISLLSEAYSFKDYHFITMGNPDLKKFCDNSAKISFVYFVPNRKDQIVFTAQTAYIDGAIGSTLKKSGENIILLPVNLNHTFNSRFDLYGSWYPLSWLEISPYLEYYIYRYQASCPVKATYFRYGGNIAASFDNFALVLNANSRTMEYDGDLISKGSMQFAATVQYKIRNWSLGVKYNFSGHNNCTYAVTEGFRFIENLDWKPLHYLFRLTATYSFSIGRSRPHSQKFINESGDDSGLNKYNKPTAPK